jgi:hypothetical protein
VIITWPGAQGAGCWAAAAAATIRPARTAIGVNGLEMRMFVPPAQWIRDVAGDPPETRGNVVARSNG